MQKSLKVIKSQLLTFSNFISLREVKLPTIHFFKRSQTANIYWKLKGIFLTLKVSEILFLNLFLFFE